MLFQHSGMLYVDEMIVPNTSINDIDENRVKEYLSKISDDIDLPIVNHTEILSSY